MHARCSAATSSSVIDDVMRNGDSFAACRISSEYALPMPSNSVGSVSDALDRVALAAQPLGELRGGRGEHVEAAAIELGERRAPGDEVQRRALLRRRLGEDQRAVRKVERGEPDLVRDLLAALLPAQPARDHQVDHDEAVALDADHDPLAEPLDALDLRAVRARCGDGDTVRSTNGLAIRMPSSGLPTVSAARRST